MYSEKRLEKLDNKIASEIEKYFYEKPFSTEKRNWKKAYKIHKMLCKYYNHGGKIGS